MLSTSKSLVVALVCGACLLGTASGIAKEAQRSPASTLSVISDRKLRTLLPAVPIYSYGLTAAAPAVGEHKFRNILVLNFGSEYEISNSALFLTRSHWGKPRLPEAIANWAPNSP